MLCRSKASNINFSSSRTRDARTASRVSVAPAMLFSPVLLDLRGKRKLYRVHAHEFQLGLAVGADDDLADPDVSFNRDFCIAFWTNTHRSVSFLSCGTSKEKSIASVVRVACCVLRVSHTPIR